MTIDLSAAIGQLIWPPILVILLGVAIVSPDPSTQRARCVSAAVGGASAMTVILFVLAVTA